MQKTLLLLLSLLILAACNSRPREYFDWSDPLIHRKGTYHFQDITLSVDHQNGYLSIDIIEKDKTSCTLPDVGISIYHSYAIYRDDANWWVYTSDTGTTIKYERTDSCKFKSTSYSWDDRTALPYDLRELTK